MLKRTPFLAILVAGIISIIIILIFEIPSRPFTITQTVLLYIISLLPSIGFAMLFDPNARENSKKFLNINFYEDK